MGDEIDRRLFPGFVETAFAISLGAAYRMTEMIKHPQKTLVGMVSEATALANTRPESGDGLQKRAQAVASAVIQRSMTLVEDWRTAGKKFTSPE
jgi:hypothetical protein